VLSPCSHAGIVNACLAAHDEFGDLPVNILLGGYLLAGKPMEPRIEPTVRHLEARITPRVVALVHCTGMGGRPSAVRTVVPADELVSPFG